MKHLPLHLGNDLPGVLLVPVAVQLLGRRAELDQEVARQVFGFDVTPLLFPQAKQCRLVVSHNDSGIGAADEGAAF
jgi:hypothetical protein